MFPCVSAMSRCDGIWFILVPDCSICVCDSIWLSGSPLFPAGSLALSGSLGFNRITSDPLCVPPCFPLVPADRPASGFRAAPLVWASSGSLWCRLVSFDSHCFHLVRSSFPPGSLCCTIGYLASKAAPSLVQLDSLWLCMDPIDSLSCSLG